MRRSPPSPTTPRTCASAPGSPPTPLVSPGMPRELATTGRSGYVSDAGSPRGFGRAVDPDQYAPDDQSAVPPDSEPALSVQPEHAASAAAAQCERLHEQQRPEQGVIAPDRFAPCLHRPHATTGSEGQWW